MSKLPSLLKRYVHAAFLCCLWIDAAPAFADTVEVTGVASDDVLNLRAEPRAGAALVGALAPSAAGIEVLKRSEGWAFVRSGKVEGWAAARFLQAPVKYGERPPSPLQCVGTEPFWSLTIDGDRATFTTPEMKPRTDQIGTFQQSRNSTIIWRMLPNDGPVASATIMARQACSDGMSDDVFPFSVNVETRDVQLLSGCCRVR